MRTLGQFIEAWKLDTVRACTPQPHHAESLATVPKIGTDEDVGGPIPPEGEEC